MICRKLMIALCLTTAMSVGAQTQNAKPAPAPAPAATAAPAAATAKPVDINAMPEGGTPAYLRPETAEQRKARLGTTEDPGINPDQTKSYWRFGKMQHIERYERKWAVYEGGDEGYIRPFGFVNVYKELYQQNERYVWVWNDDAEPPLPQDKIVEAAQNGGYRQFGAEDLKFFQKIRSEFSEFTPPTTNTVIRFEESSEGLPTGGSWRNSLAVADMNGDGFMDIIAPPERAGGNIPVIFLGDGKGHWKVWQVKWPHGLDYGSVTAADFNKDGHMDLAFGVHLNGVYVFLGDGQGNFTESSKGLAHDFPTRRVTTADVDNDGYPDVVAISEGPTAVQRPEDATYGRIRVYLNRDKGTAWEGINVAAPENRFGGDWLSVGNFNGDKYPDFAAASIFFNASNTIWLSNGLRKWKPLANVDPNYVVPYASYYFASAVGRFSKQKLDEVAVSYARFWPTDMNPHLVPDPPAKNVIGIDRITFAADGSAKRTSIVRWASNRSLWGVASGDFNGDGNDDIMYTRFDPREGVILLGDGKGNFARCKVEGLTLSPNSNYDLKVADVNGDKLPDVILMYESSGKSAFSSRDGSIHVFLNRGATTGAAATSTK